MNRRRTGLAVLGLATLAACVVNISFTITQSVALTGAASDPKSIATAQQFNLLDNADVAAHRANVKSIEIDNIVGTISSVGTNPANAATIVTGALYLRKTATDTAHDVKIADVTNFPLTAGSTKTFPGTPTLDTFLMDALQGDGKFLVVVSGSVDQSPVNVVLKVDVHASIAYDAGIL